MPSTYGDIMSSDVSLAPSLPPHILLHSFHSPFHFLPSFCSEFFPFCVIAHTLFCLFLIFPTFSAFCPFSGHPWFLISGVLTTSPHFPSSDPSGPETPSSSAHRPLPPPKVLTPRHTAVCTAVDSLGLWGGLVAKAHLSPWRCLSWCVGGVVWGGGGYLVIVSPFSQWWAVYSALPF